jgi:hypothetical protein
MKKAYLVSLPLMDSGYPSASLAAISPVFVANGYSVMIQDLNLALVEEFDQTVVDKFHDWCQLVNELSESDQDLIRTWVINKAQAWSISNDTIVAVSVFSIYSTRMSTLLLEIIKELYPDTTVIVGGSGVSSNMGSMSGHKLYGQWLLDQNLANNVIFGEGEISLDHLLKQQQYPGIDHDDAVQIEDLDQLPQPVYDDFEMDRYKDKRLLITGSRGCVRKCSFCDIEVTWPRFRQRDPAKILTEMITNVKHYGIKRFEFTDSLINGSVKNWIKFNDLLANARAKDKELADITYSGQFICRDPKSQPPIMYELMHHAGCQQITVGIESFSERVRMDMKKKFSDAAIDYHLEQCSYWSIPNILLMIVGYPIETQEDHQKNIQALHRYKIYSDVGTIFMIRWGLTMHIYRDTPLFHAAQNYQIDLEQHHSDLDAIYTWISGINQDLDFLERARRRAELHQIGYELGYSQPNTKNELSSLLTLLEKYQPVQAKKVFSINV